MIVEQPVRALVALVFAFVAPSTAMAEWLVLPIHAEHPPPTDPTLLRTSERVGRAIADGLGVDVRLAARAIRDEHCTDDGHHCPTAIARILEAERVIALELTDDHGELRATVYRRPAVVAATVRVKCAWDHGPKCALDDLVEQLRASMKVAFDAVALETAWTKLRPRIDGCLARAKAVEPTASVKFSVQRDGRVANVRIEPRKLQRKKAYTCVARVVESLRVPPFEGPMPPMFRRALVSP